MRKICSTHKLKAGQFDLVCIPQLLEDITIKAGVILQQILQTE